MHTKVAACGAREASSREEGQQDEEESQQQQQQEEERFGPGGGLALHAYAMLGGGLALHARRRPHEGCEAVEGALSVRHHHLRVVVVHHLPPGGAHEDATPARSGEVVGAGGA